MTRVFEDEERVPTPTDASERILGGSVPQVRDAPDDLASEARALLRRAALRDEVATSRGVDHGAVES